jgi:PAT family beta-lactamase induction signal transducer AmpG
MAIGYRNFFVWVLISAVPALLLARFVPIGSPAAVELEEQPHHA